MPVPHNWQRPCPDFLSPGLKTLDHPRQRACLPRYVRGLRAPLERKSTEPIAEHVGLPYQRLHHFLNVSPWNTDLAPAGRAGHQLNGGSRRGRRHLGSLGGRARPEIQVRGCPLGVPTTGGAWKPHCSGPAPSWGSTWCSLGRRKRRPHVARAGMPAVAVVVRGLSGSAQHENAGGCPTFARAGTHPSGSRLR